MLLAFSIVSAVRSFDRVRTDKRQRLQVAMQDSVRHDSRGDWLGLNTADVADLRQHNII